MKMIVIVDVVFPRVEVPTEKRVRRWGLSMEELISDVMGEFSPSLAIFLSYHYSFSIISSKD